MSNTMMFADRIDTLTQQRVTEVLQSVGKTMSDMVIKFLADGGAARSGITPSRANPTSPSRVAAADARRIPAR